MLYTGGYTSTENSFEQNGLHFMGEVDVTAMKLWSALHLDSTASSNEGWRWSRAMSSSLWEQGVGQPHCTSSYLTDFVENFLYVVHAVRVGDDVERDRHRCVDQDPLKSADVSAKTPRKFATATHTKGLKSGSQSLKFHPPWRRLHIA